MAEKQKKTWTSPKSNLSQALEEWSSISQSVKEEGKLAPDEKMLKEIEGILVELKSKLEEFSPPKPTSSATPQDSATQDSEHEALS